MTDLPNPLESLDHGALEADLAIYQEMQGKMTDWSQSNEQSMILEWADRRASKGRWLDIGAVDGEVASNVRALALRGWGGTAVEPAAWAFDKLAALYSEREDVETVQAAIVVEPSPLIRWHYAHDLLSTTEDAYRDKWAEQVRFTPTYVAAVTVEQFLAVLPGPYDMISVDIEGTTLPVTKALLDAGALAPGGLLCVECEDGGERFVAQQWCLDGFARLGTTPNNLLLESLP